MNKAMEREKFPFDPETQERLSEFGLSDFWSVQKYRDEKAATVNVLEQILSFN